MCIGLISGRVLTALHCWDTINQLECVTELPCRVMLDVSAGAGKGLFVSLCLLGLFMEWCVRLTCCRVVTKTDLKNAWGFSVPWPGLIFSVVLITNLSQSLMLCVSRRGFASSLCDTGGLWVWVWADGCCHHMHLLRNGSQLEKHPCCWFILWRQKLSRGTHPGSTTFPLQYHLSQKYSASYRGLEILFCNEKLH